MANYDDEVDPSVNFLYKTMLQRDPHKRRVKLVQKHLVQVDFGLEDSDEDSDFDIGQHQDSDSEEMGDDEQEEVMELGAAEANKSVADSAGAIINNDVEDVNTDDDEISDEDSDEDGSEEDYDDDNEDISEEENEQTVDDKDGTQKVLKAKGLNGIFDGMDSSDDEDEDYVPQKKKKKSATQNTFKTKSAEVDNCCKDMSPAAQKVSSPEQSQTQSQGQIKVLICCVCLSDQSADDDEIVECDNCGISVHEGCYGISDNQSLASTESSASTEPWFCDACKAGIVAHCELCPNSGGIYKETDAGKWVHIVCALYTPGVAFGDVDKLCPVTLFEMQYNKWGAKECSLCEDVRFSRTGVCICCDAGMCRSFFHVTCAQREGLLTEADPGEVMDIADPFFAYCKQHVDKLTMKGRRRHWLAIQSHVRSYVPKVIDDQKEQLRFERKLRRHREKYIISRNKRPPSWVPTQKMVRHLHTSPYAVRAFMRKGELMGVVTHVEQSSLEKQEARKKPHITPALSGEFIQYYFGRNTKIEQLRATMIDLTAQNVVLRDQEKVLRIQYDQLSHDLIRLRDSTAKIRNRGEKLWNIMSDISGKGTAIPELFRPKKRQRSPSKIETPLSPTSLIHQCGICMQTTDQHLLAKCDSCHRHFHLGCLNPPLSRMPKKSKLFGWQCSQCAITSSEESEASAGTRLMDEPRRLREVIKEPIKFRTLQSQEAAKKNKKQSTKSKKKRKPQSNSAAVALASEPSILTSSLAPASVSKGKKSPPVTVSNQQPLPSPASTESSSRERKTRRETRKEECAKQNKDEIWEMHFQCVVCNMEGDASTTVRCDECLLCYHFYCLDPPVRKSPKVRGYAWHCEACDPTDASDVYLVEEDEEDMSRSSDSNANSSKAPSEEHSSSSTIKT